MLFRWIISHDEIEYDLDKTHNLYYQEELAGFKRDINTFTGIDRFANSLHPDEIRNIKFGPMDQNNNVTLFDFIPQS